MRRLTPLRLLAAAALLAALLLPAGCSLFGTTAAERVARFEKDLNDSPEFVYQNFLESATTDYTAIQDRYSTWDEWFPPASTAYTVEITTITQTAATGTISGGSFTDPLPIELGLVQADPLTWYLESLTLDGATLVD